MQLIGKGTFSKVYRISENKVKIVSSDWAKECQALFIDSFLVPKLEKIDYEMEYFDKVQSLKNSLLPGQYEIYKELRALPFFYCANSYDYLDKLRDNFKLLKNEKVKEGLMDVLDELSNYGTDIVFEISPRNVAVKNGKLVLLDCFFFKSQLTQVRTSKKRYHYA